MSMGGANAKRAETAKQIEPLEVQISIPSGDDCKTDFAISLANMMRYNSIEFDRRRISFLTGIANARRSNLAASRNLLVQRGLDGGATHILFVDSDMTFPPHTLATLLARCYQCGIDIVGCTAASRQQNGVSRGTGATRVRPDGYSAFFDIQKTSGVVEVDRTGTGVLLISSRVFRRLPKPWFLFAWDDAHGTIEGEDYHFCRKAQEAGFSIHVDFDLSREIGHIGSFTYTLDEAADVASVREAEAGKHVVSPHLSTGSAA